LLAPQDQKRHCRHCHLTINMEELADGFCPECYEVCGRNAGILSSLNRRMKIKPGIEGDKSTFDCCEKIVTFINF
jgi:hypothetical protein